MRVLVTGAFGFIGSHLVEALLARGALTGQGGVPQPLRELVLVDVVEGGARFADDPRVRRVVGDASDARLLTQVVGAGVDAVFALGATLTSQAEADFARGYEVNMHGVLRLLEVCRLRENAPRFVFASSIAAFGGPLPEVVEDAQQLTPQTSYGTQKAIDELLINDYARRGFVDGRALRLPVVLVRPAGGPSGAISDRVAALIREPLAGRDVTCPLRADTLVPVASSRAVARALLAVHDVPKHQLGHTRALNLDSTSVRLGVLVEAAQMHARRLGQTAGRVTYAPDQALQAIVDQWPRRFESQRARALGIRGDASIDAIIEHYLSDRESVGGVHG